MKKSTLTIGSLLLALSPLASAQCWDYHIVDLTDATNALNTRASDRLEASAELLAALNRLGAQGWELATQHTVRIGREGGGGDELSDEVWTAKLSPSSALFKREIQCR